MKARKVKRLDPDGWLTEAARRIVLVRLDELRSFAAAARDPSRAREQHDMRIAAKRLRYVLELHEPVFGAPAARAAKTARELQDLLGEIHDCDELLPLISQHQRKLRDEDARALASAGAEGGADAIASAAPAPNAPLYSGLERLRAITRARREVLHARFVRRWDELDSQDLAGKLEWDLERAAARAMEQVAARERREADEREAAERAARLEQRARAEAERLLRRLGGDGAGTMAEAAGDEAPAGGEGTTAR